MRSRLLSVASALALALGGLVVALAPAGPASAHCSGHDTHPDVYEGGRIKYLAGGTAIRRYPHIYESGCSPVIGVGYASDGVDVHCYTLTGDYWLYIRNLDTGVNGWSRWDVLDYTGSPDDPIVIDSCGGVNGPIWIYPAGEGEVSARPAMV